MIYKELKLRFCIVPAGAVIGASYSSYLCLAFGRWICELLFHNRVKALCAEIDAQLYTKTEHMFVKAKILCYNKQNNIFLARRGEYFDSNRYRRL